MPYKDHDKKVEAMRRWRQDVMPKGYGKWLYARRKLRFEDAERFREVIEEAVESLIVALNSEDPEDITEQVERALGGLQLALQESMEAEQALGPWDGGQHEAQDEVAE